MNKKQPPKAHRVNISVTLHLRQLVEGAEQQGILLSEAGALHSLVAAGIKALFQPETHK